MKLAEWHSWRELFGLCHFIIAARPGHALATYPRCPAAGVKGGVRLDAGYRSADSLKQVSSGLIFIAPTTLLDISATIIRVRVAAGKSIRYLIPDAALDYIAANHLYSEEG